MIKIISHNRPTLTGAEIKAASRVLKSGWLACGEEVAQFEKEFVNYLNHGRGSALAVSSGSAALYLALIGLSIERGDEVIIPTYACSAVLNAIRLVGAKEILVDINEADLNINVAEVKRRITGKTKAIIVTHTFGFPAQLKELMSLKIPVIEDCAQALGTKFQGRLLGTFGQISIYSFYASKMMTAGYGGMIYSKDKKIISRIKDYLEFDGRTNYYPRFNFLLSDINAAIGRTQLKKLSSFIRRRNLIARKYSCIIPVNYFWPEADVKSKLNYYRFLIKSDNALKIKKALAESGIKTIVPIEKFELLHRYLKINPVNFPVSEKIAKTTLSLPIFPALKNSEINLICRRIKQIKELI